MYCPTVGSMPDERTPRATPSLISSSRTADSANDDDADRGKRVEPQRRADGDEEDDQHRRRSALDGRLQRIALSDRQVLDDESRGHGREQRLELLRACRPG